MVEKPSRRRVFPEEAKVITLAWLCLANDYFESLQYRQDVRHIAHYYNRKKTSLPIHVAQKITVIYVRRKSENRRFEIWYSVVAPFGGAEKNLNMGTHTTAQPQIIPYKKHLFLKLHGLIDFRCTQTLALPCAFGTTVTSWQFFVAPCNEVAKYLYRVHIHNTWGKRLW